MAIKIQCLSPIEAISHHGPLAAIYRAVFSGPPYHESEEAIAAFPTHFTRHAQNKDFRCVVARNGETIVGVAYGYASRPGQWWHDAITAELDDGTEKRWFRDAFEFVELAVLPDHQARGIGGRLHDELLAVVGQKTAVLSTLYAETAAFHLYRKRGWQTLHAPFCFPGGDNPYRIMGRRVRFK